MLNAKLDGALSWGYCETLCRTLWIFHFLNGAMSVVRNTWCARFKHVSWKKNGLRLLTVLEGGTGVWNICWFCGLGRASWDIDESWVLLLTSCIEILQRIDYMLRGASESVLLRSEIVSLEIVREVYKFFIRPRTIYSQEMYSSGQLTLFMSHGW